MGEDRDNVLERLSSVETQLKELSEIKSKIDAMYQLIVNIQLDNANSKNNFVSQAEHVALRKDLEARIEKADEGRKKLFWASVSSGLVFLLWLVEQLMHVSITLGK